MQQLTKQEAIDLAWYYYFIQSFIIDDDKVFEIKEYPHENDEKMFKIVLAIHDSKNNHLLYLQDLDDFCKLHNIPFPTISNLKKKPF